MPAALILTLDAALDGCSAAIVSDGAVLAERSHGGGRGSAAVLPELARAVMAQACVSPPAMEMIAVTVGPGSFTGVRAALALAQGLGLAAGVAVRGVTVGDAIRAGLAPDREEDDTPIWVAIDRGRGGVFLDIGGTVTSLALSDVPDPPRLVRLAGNAAQAVGAVLVGRGHRVRVLDMAGPAAPGIARGAARSGREAVPLYVDPVEARPGPAVRPAPV